MTLHCAFHLGVMFGSKLYDPADMGESLLGDKFYERRRILEILIITTLSRW